MKKTDPKFTKAITDIITEESIDRLKFQSVIDRSWSHGYNRGWVKGYLSGVYMTGILLGIAWVWRTVGRLEGVEKGVEKGKKEAAFWRKLYAFNAESRFGKNCNKSSDKKSDKEDIDGDTEKINDDSEGKC